MIRPWLMWGNTLELPNLRSAAAMTPIDQAAVNSQLLRVNYGRPETWRFLFAATLVAATGGEAATSLSVNFDVTAGVGRSAVTLKDFLVFTFSGFPGLTVPQQRWACSTEQPAFSPTDTQHRFIETFSAQDIQVSVRTIFLTGFVGATAMLSIYGGVTPNVHVRPEWHSAAPNDHKRFSGENNGS